MTEITDPDIIHDILMELKKPVPPKEFFDKKIEFLEKFMGKAYANRKSVEERPESDFYPTPSSLVWELLKTGILDNCKTILEPACGDKAISNELEKAGFTVVSRDLKLGNNFLTDKYTYREFDAVVTNPPFSLFDEFAIKANKISSKVVLLGKTNFFGAYQRAQNGLWKNLKDNYIFNRQVDYRSPYRKDGKFHCGNLITGWFHWDKSWTENYWRSQIIDVQKYVIPDLENFIKNKLKKFLTEDGYLKFNYVDGNCLVTVYSYRVDDVNDLVDYINTTISPYLNSTGTAEYKFII